MKILIALHILWSLILLVLFALKQVAIASWEGCWVVCLHLLYLSGALSLLRNSRLGWWVCVLTPLAIMARFLPPVLQVASLYLTNDQRLVDSPGTLLVALAVAVIFVLPAFVIVLLEVRLRRQIGNRLIGRQ
jgi:hypothetical protein